jgi:hypothetical protein
MSTVIQLREILFVILRQICAVQITNNKKSWKKGKMSHYRMFLTHVLVMLYHRGTPCFPWPLVRLPRGNKSLGNFLYWSKFLPLF